MRSVGTPALGAATVTEVPLAGRRGVTRMVLTTAAGETAAAAVTAAAVPTSPRT